MEMFSGTPDILCYVVSYDYVLHMIIICLLNDGELSELVDLHGRSFWNAKGLAGS